MDTRLSLSLLVVVAIAFIGCSNGGDSKPGTGGEGADFDASLYYTKSEIDTKFYSKTEADANYYSKSHIDGSYYAKTEIDNQITLGSTEYAYTQVGWANRATLALTGALATKRGVLVEIHAPAQSADYSVRIGIAESDVTNALFLIKPAQSTLVFYSIPAGATAIHFWSNSGEMVAGSGIFCKPVLFID